MADKHFLVSIDLNGNELKKAIVEKLSSPPENAKEGQIYYNTRDKNFYHYTGSEWRTGKTYTATNAASEGPNQIAVFHQLDGTTFQFRVLKGDNYLTLERDENNRGIINLTFERDKLAEFYRLDGLATKVDKIANNLASFDSIKLQTRNGVANTNVWFTDFGAKTLNTNYLGFRLNYTDFDGEKYISDFDSVKMSLGTGVFSDCVEIDETNHYFGNSVQIVWNENTDEQRPLTFRIKKGDITKDLTTYVYGLRGPRYFGRLNTNTPSSAQIQALSVDGTYTYGNLKYRTGVDIPANTTNLYFAYAYPQAWGALTKIYNSLGTYYTEALDAAGKSTFTRKTASINGVSYYVYVYRDINKSAATGLIFI